MLGWGFSFMRRYDAILFDFDGVLIDSEPVHWACWAEVLKPLGVILGWEFYRDHCIGIDDREMLRMMATASTPPRDWEEMWAQYPRKKELFRERMLTSPPFPDGLESLIAELAREYALAVVTSSSRTEVEPLLRAGGLWPHLRTLVGAEDVDRNFHKPAPDPYLLAAKRLEARTPLVLEDSPAGIASGTAAGFEVVPVKHPREVAKLLAEKLGTVESAGG
jgi:beta-phosphoglucomutase